MILADTAFLVALLWPSDALHARATKWSATLRDRVLITEYVLIETINFSADPRYRARVFGLIDSLVQDSGFEVVYASRDLFQAALDLLRQRADKQWSVADAASFVVMHDHGITDALTHDHHFEQAGFRALLREDPPAA